MQKRTKHKIALVIHPTQYEDYDILALGSFKILRQLALKHKHTNLIKSSVFGGIPILVLDTADTMRDAVKILKQHQETYAPEP
jgi:hypothetical protein